MCFFLKGFREILVLPSPAPAPAPTPIAALAPDYAPAHAFFKSQNQFSLSPEILQL